MTQTIDTGSPDLLAERTGEHGRVAVLTLNRPDRRNALSAGMLGALAQVLEDCERDPEVRCVVLTGAGTAFCAGGDVKEMAARGGGGSGPGGGSFSEHLATQRHSQRATVARIYRMPKPVIASLPGAAAGAGMGLAMACDLRIAADTAIMMTAFARVGYSGDYGLPWLLTQQLGRARALELLYLSERLPAERCHQLGLVNQIVPSDQLRERTLELAERLAGGPSVALGYIKGNVNAAFEQPLEQAMEAEVMRILDAARTEDHREAAQAFVDKREPRFRGR